MKKENLVIWILEKRKQKHDVFKSNLNKISKGRYKSEEQRSALQNIKLILEAKEAVIKLFNIYCLIASDAKYDALMQKHIQVCKLRSL